MSKAQRLMKQETKGNNEGERLARFMAHAGVASRRQAEEWIAEGRVMVNGEVITTQGFKIDPTRDKVQVNGRYIKAVELERVYILLHKPEGYLSTVNDPQKRKTVLHLLPPEIQNLRVYPVGRLDADTSGLLLLTNDGDFALKLSHPRYGKEKHYEALVQGQPSSEAIEALKRGITIIDDDGTPHKTAPAKAHVIRRYGNQSWLALTLREGHKRQVRRMLMRVGYPVQKLIRVGVGNLALQGVPVGKWRYLSEAEVKGLL